MKLREPSAFLLVSLSLLSGCVCLNHENWSMYTVVPPDDQWRVVYSNQWPQQLHALYILNATRESELIEGSIFARIVNAEPGEDLSAGRVNDSGELDISLPGTRRYVRAFSGDRLWLKAKGRQGVVKVKLVESTQAEGLEEEDD